MTGPEIKELREHLGLEQRAMALLIGCYQHHLSRWESGKVKPGRQWQQIFADLDRRRDTPELHAKAKIAESLAFAEGHRPKSLS